MHPSATHPQRWLVSMCEDTPPSLAHLATSPVAISIGGDLNASVDSQYAKAWRLTARIATRPTNR